MMPRLYFVSRISRVCVQAQIWMYSTVDNFAIVVYNPLLIIVRYGMYIPIHEHHILA